MRFKKRKNKLTKDAVFYIYFIISMIFWLLTYWYVIPNKDSLFPDAFDSVFWFVFILEMFRISLTIIFIIITDDDEFLRCEKISFSGITNSILFGLMLFNFLIVFIVVIFLSEI